MSLLIKGVEMPDSCLNCRFRTTILKNVLSPTGRTSVYACLIGGMELNIIATKRHKDCPLVEVPTPHGRLIDADKLTKNMRNYYPSIDHLCCSQHVVTKRDIDNAPTVIEAEA